MTLLVTGGAGFIGSAVVRLAIAESDAAIVNVDKLTYAAAPDALAELQALPGAEGRYAFERVDIADAAAVRALFERHAPTAVLHLAAETHVDRSIDGPAAFVQTNVVGTYTLLEAARVHWERLDPAARARFRFVHVSTDEVFGALGEEGYFREDSPYRPSSPYSATKAASDHMARAWAHTYGLPVIVTNCSNNYGPHQHPEKLIPLTVQRAAEGREIPVYGTGRQVRDWLYVDDHARGLLAALARGRPGETYLFGGRSERRNGDVVRAICALVDELRPDPEVGPRAGLIHHVTDRPGHDWRYAIDPSKAEAELGWRPHETFESGIRRTVAWLLDHGTWRGTGEHAYRGERLGLPGQATGSTATGSAATGSVA
jgi:dTDP-glucose 4,6-dehydratase